jgi:hypothetical protein
MTFFLHVVVISHVLPWIFELDLTSLPIMAILEWYERTFHICLGYVRAFGFYQTPPWPLFGSLFHLPLNPLNLLYFLPLLALLLLFILPPSLFLPSRLSIWCMVSLITSHEVDTIICLSPRSLWRLKILFPTTRSTLLLIYRLELIL